MPELKGYRLKILNYWLRWCSYKWNGSYIHRGSEIRCPKLILGKGTRINGKIVIKGSGDVIIGMYCAIGDACRIISSNHATNVLSIQYNLQRSITGRLFNESRKKGIEIGHDVWIGDQVIILPGVKIENGAVVGAGSVVTRNVEAYSVVGGVPARHIGHRCGKELAALIEHMRWWTWSEKDMKKRAWIFEPWKDEAEMMRRIEQLESSASN